MTGATNVEEEFDVVVLGAGPAGENLADYAIRGSDRTAALVERELVGGECSYFACMPSKALLRPIEVADLTAHLDGVREAQVDPQALLARRDEWVSSYRDAGQVEWAQGAGIEVVRGEGRLVGERLVEVTGSDGTRVLRARLAVGLATGSEPVVPSPYAACLPWGSRDATGVVEVPGRIVIVGGGVVACEAAVWLRALGAEVTMVVRGERLLASMEPFASQHVLDSLTERGVDVRLSTEVTGCTRKDARDTGLGRVHGGPVTVSLGEERLTADELLLAVGRRPRLGDVGLENVGLTEQQVLDGDVPEWLVRVGDASGEAPLTHWGKYRARVLGENLAGRAERAEASSGIEPDGEVLARQALDRQADESQQVDPPVPQVVFTIPQVAQVGLTQERAQAAYDDIAVAHVDWDAASGAALLSDDTRGGAQLVVDAGSGLVVGATFVGQGAGELLHAATIAITGEVPVHRLRHAVPSYPTASELWLRLLEALPSSLRRTASTRRRSS